jgi:hypothetical protein
VSAILESRVGRVAEASQEIGPPAALATASREAAPADAPFGAYLENLGHQIDRGESLIGHALHGAGQLDAAQLIALQAGIFRYTEAIDLAAKFVDRASSAIRTTLQSSG